MRRDVLNTLSSVLDQSTRIAVSLVVTPILLTNLGQSLFGLWQVLLKTSSQIASLDGRSPEVLKWSLAQKNREYNDEEKRSSIGDAISCALVFFPLVLVLFAAWALVAAFSRSQNSLNEGYLPGVILILFLNATVATATNLTSGVLRGMNEGYRRMGVQAAIVAIGGAGSVLVLWRGGGLLSLAIVQLSVSIITLTTFYLVVKKHFQWFSFVRPRFNKLREPLAKCGWFTSWAFVNTGLLCCDVQLLGFLGTHDSVARYAVSQYLIQFVATIAFTVFAAVLPGTAGLVGSGQMATARSRHQEITQYARIFVLSASGAIIVCNKSFVSAWVGTDVFAGGYENVLIGIAGFQLALIRLDSAFINITLSLRAKLLFGVGALTLIVAIASYTVPRWNIIGVCMALILGRLTLMVAYPWLASQILKVPETDIRQSLRWIILSCLAFGLCGYLSFQVPVVSLSLLPVVFLVVSGGIGALCIVGVLSRKDRTQLAMRVTKLYRLALASSDNR